MAYTAIGSGDSFNRTLDCSVRVYQFCNIYCAKYPATKPPIYVKDHYYCESGSTGKPPSLTSFSGSHQVDSEANSSN